MSWMSLRSVLPGSSWLHSPIFWFTCESNLLGREEGGEGVMFNLFLQHRVATAFLRRCVKGNDTSSLKAQAS